MTVNIINFRPIVYFPFRFYRICNFDIFVFACCNYIMQTCVITQNNSAKQLWLFKIKWVNKSSVSCNRLVSASGVFRVSVRRDEELCKCEVWPCTRPKLFNLHRAPRNFATLTSSNHATAISNKSKTRTKCPKHIGRARFISTAHWL